LCADHLLCVPPLLYSRTKLMDLMVAKEWARRLHGTGIEVREVDSIK
jgi:hypothetical protein